MPKGSLLYISAACVGADGGNRISNMSDGDCPVKCRDSPAHWQHPPISPLDFLKIH